MQRRCGYKKTLPRTSVVTNYQGLLAKLLSVTTEIGQSRRVIDNFPEDRTDSLLTEEAQGTIRVGNKWN